MNCFKRNFGWQFFQTAATGQNVAFRSLTMGSDDIVDSKHTNSVDNGSSAG